MTDIVERLRKIESLKTDDLMPEENWSKTLSELCGESADEIERLRTMVSEYKAGMNQLSVMNQQIRDTLTGGPSFADIKKDIRNG